MTPEPSETPESAPRRRRRFVRHRWTRLGAAAAVGVLLGASLTAWRTGALTPDGDGRACWDALSPADVRAVAESEETPTTDEFTELAGLHPNDGPRASCRITGREQGVGIELHRLRDLGPRGADRDWSRTFLTARMSPLGGGLLGMASDTAAWLAVPDGCAGRFKYEGPLVVDVRRGLVNTHEEPRADRREVLAHAAVKLVNGVIDRLGCEHHIPLPRHDGMPPPPRYRTAKGGTLCGVPVPRAAREEKERRMRTRGGGASSPARVCELDLPPEPHLRLTTVQDARLATAYESLDAGPRVRGAPGYGYVRGDEAMFRAVCQTGPVVFLAERPHSPDEPELRELFARYVAREAERLACGPVDFRAAPRD
ncbi:hypothetical protein GCM10009801_78310 [Streptomyces albiaxialis]|uniref:Uncharacterized protein n=1 Tax=Streptomyces albiaxialis TaxID=329523 RepID=A0ABN2X272_9ACTN